jgi:predicted GIY-YIG superfamily endonuclease
MPRKKGRWVCPLTKQEKKEAELLVSGIMDSLPVGVGDVGDHGVYILRSMRPEKHTYCGYTKNLRNRLRQHNRIISKGAGYTTSKRCKWTLMAFVSGLDKSEAMSLEFWSKAKALKRCAKDKFKEMPSTKNTLKRRGWLFREALKRKEVDLERVVFLDNEFESFTRST